MNIFGGHCNTD